MKYKKIIAIISLVVLLINILVFTATGSNSTEINEINISESNVLSVKTTAFIREVYKPPSTVLTIKTTAPKAKLTKTTTKVKQKSTTSVINKKQKKLAVKKTKSKKFKTKETYQIIRGYSPPKNVNTSFKSYMCYRTITCINSNQYILQQKAHTDKDGIRCVGKDVCIALGTRYSSTVGERFLIELNTGKSFTAIVGDIKSDVHTDKKTHSYIETNGNVVEFIVDDKKISNDIRFTGDMSCIDKYKGQIKAILKIA